MRLKKKWLFAAAPFFAAAFVFVIGELVMSLWNWIAAGLFGLPQVTFWQAWGLLLLCRILFGGFGGGGGERRRRHRPDDTREQLRERLRTQCGPETPPPAAAL
jgi:hypothetical protein